MPNGEIENHLDLKTCVLVQMMMQMSLLLMLFQWSVAIMMLMDLSYLLPIVSLLLIMYLVYVMTSLPMKERSERVRFHLLPFECVRDGNKKKKYFDNSSILEKNVFVNVENVP